MTEQEILARFAATRQPVVETFNGHVLEVDPDTGRIAMGFLATRRMCHSVDGHPLGGIVQGGFVAGFMDTSMAHACVARSKFTVAVPTLELKVNFLAPAHPGKLRTEARIRHWGRSIVFLEAELHADDGRLLATASSTAKLVHLKSTAAA